MKKRNDLIGMCVKLPYRGAGIIIRLGIEPPGQYHIKHKISGIVEGPYTEAEIMSFGPMTRERYEVKYMNKHPIRLDTLAHLTSLN